MDDQSFSSMKYRVLSHIEAYRNRAAEPMDGTPMRGKPNAFWLFFLESLHSLRMTASVFPSSRDLASALAQPIDFARAANVVELGSGTGAVTREILKRLGPDTKLFAVEMIPAFIEHLEATCRDPRLILLAGSATDLQTLLAQHDVRSVDAVVSSLPLAAMDDETRLSILQQVGACLDPQGVMTQCQWEISKHKPGGFNEEGFLRSLFSEVQVKRVLLNLPPTLVFTCRKWISGNMRHFPPA